MKNLKLNNKNIMIMAGAVIGIIVIVIVLISIISNGDNSQQKQLEKRMEELGQDFYENFYYKQLGTTDDREDFLKKYETLGIKVNLDNLARYNKDDTEEILKEFVNKKTDKQCDKLNSKVVIYPQDPYKQTSYKIEVKLDCGFEEQK